MFTGIIQKLGTLGRRVPRGNGQRLTIRHDAWESPLTLGESVAVNGVCLTVVDIKDGLYTVTAVQETLIKSNLGLVKVGDKVNLERSMKPDSLLDGHIVQGHVDQTAVCTKVEEADGSWYYTFEYEPQNDNITVEKGSVSVNGVSLTVVNSKDKSFQVAIIPFTHDITNFHTIKHGTVVNIEFDIIGKYITKIVKQYLGK